MIESLVGISQIKKLSIMKVLAVIAVVFMANNAVNADITSDAIKMMLECSKSTEVPMGEYLTAAMNKQVDDNVCKMTQCLLEKLHVLKPNNVIDHKMLDALITIVREQSKTDKSKGMADALKNLDDMKDCFDTITIDENDDYPVARPLAECMVEKQ